jgi:hypothetical protein
VKNLRARFPETRFEAVSFQDTLAASVPILLGVAGVDYETFKKTDYYGRTGRQHIIDVATKKREFDPLFFSRVLADRMRTMNHTTHTGRRRVFIADSNGFADELGFMRGQTDIDLLPCSIEPPDTVARGEKYPDPDSRFNLAHMCAVVTPDSSVMLERLSERLIARGWAA